MSLQGTIKRYSLIIDYTRRSSYPSFKQIHEMLQDEGFQISSRTLQRDLEDIRDEFGIELSYDTSKNGYFIDYEKSANADYILHFLELAVSAQVMIESLKEGKASLKYIAFDSYDNLRGVHNLQRLLFAIKNHRKISFNHTSYQTGKTINFRVNPYLLKEFQGRWYFYAETPSLKDFRTYGIDRIDKLEISDETFKPIKDIDFSQRFNNIIGVSNPDSDHAELQDIVLSFDKEQGLYFKSLPWHSSFTILADDEMEFRVALHIIPNYELFQRILMYTDSVNVIEPLWLKERVKIALAEALKRYS